MAINRGPWNALVDDDGSNLVGSVWNKTAIKDVILDPVDAAFGVTWADVPYNAADFTIAGTGGWSVAAGGMVTFAYARIGNVMLVALYLTPTTITGAPVYLQVKIPGGLVPNRVSGSPYSFTSASAAGTGYGLIEGGQIKLLRDQLATSWGAGTWTMNGTFTIFL